GYGQAGGDNGGSDVAINVVVGGRARVVVIVVALDVDHRVAEHGNDGRGLGDRRGQNGDAQGDEEGLLAHARSLRIRVLRNFSSFSRVEAARKNPSDELIINQVWRRSNVHLVRCFWNYHRALALN